MEPDAKAPPSLRLSSGVGTSTSLGADLMSPGSTSSNCQRPLAGKGPATSFPSSAFGRASSAVTAAATTGGGGEDALAAGTGAPNRAWMAAQASDGKLRKSGLTTGLVSTTVPTNSAALACFSGTAAGACCSKFLCMADQASDGKAAQVRSDNWPGLHNRPH